MFSYGQEKNDTIQVIAKIVYPGIGSKIHIAKFQVIKTIQGHVSSDTIKVGYYFYNAPDKLNFPDTALLNLTTYTGGTATEDYYIFQNYDAKNNVEPAKISTVDFDYWEGCETGEGACIPLRFTRSLKDVRWFLFMPCGGTQTDVTFSEAAENGLEMELHIYSEDCPPAFDISEAPDGKYYAYMLGCALGGQIEINLETKKE